MVEGASDKQKTLSSRLVGIGYSLMGEWRIFQFLALGLIVNPFRSCFSSIFFTLSAAAKISCCPSVLLGSPAWCQGAQQLNPTCPPPWCWSATWTRWGWCSVGWWCWTRRTRRRRTPWSSVPTGGGFLLSKRRSPRAAAFSGDRQGGNVRIWRTWAASDTFAIAQLTQITPSPAAIHRTVENAEHFWTTL